MYLVDLHSFSLAPQMLAPFSLEVLLLLLAVVCAYLLWILPSPIEPPTSLPPVDRKDGLFDLEGRPSYRYSLPYALLLMSVPALALALDYACHHMDCGQYDNMPREDWFSGDKHPHN